MMARSFSSDNKELAMLLGAINFFSFNFDTAIGSKSTKTSLHNRYTSEMSLLIKYDGTSVGTIPNYVPFA